MEFMQANQKRTTFPGGGNMGRQAPKKRRTERKRKTDRCKVHLKWQLLAASHRSRNQTPTKYLNSRTRLHFGLSEVSLGVCSGGDGFFPMTWGPARVRKFSSVWFAAIYA